MLFFEFKNENETKYIFFLRDKKNTKCSFTKKRNVDIPSGEDLIRLNSSELKKSRLGRNVQFLCFALLHIVGREKILRIRIFREKSLVLPKLTTVQYFEKLGSIFLLLLEKKKDYFIESRDIDLIHIFFLYSYIYIIHMYYVCVYISVSISLQH